MVESFPFWKNELQTLSSLIDEIAPDFSICVTGIPSFERSYAIETVLKKKQLDYYVSCCSSRSTSRSLLFDVCFHLARFLDMPYTFKSTGELLLDLQDYAEKYYQSRNEEKCFYCVFDNCENLDTDTFDLICRISSKVSHLGVILLTISLDSYRLFPSFIIHFPTIPNNEIESVLLADIPSTSVPAEAIVSCIVRYFATQTHSISELKTLRDMVIAYCKDHGISTIKDVESYVQTMQQSLFVNIMPIYTDRMDSVLDSTGTIPLSDFCGVDISYNAKLLLIASYLCSIYPESEDCKLFGRDNQLNVKTKGRKKRRINAVVSTSKSSHFSVHRLIALYNAIKQNIFPDSHSVSSNYELLLSQINVLTQLGLLAQVGGNSHSINLNQMLYRCNLNRVNVINIAKNIQFDILPYV